MTTPETRFVTGFLIGDSGLSVALVKKARPAWQRGKWNGIGGAAEPGETPLAAMVREFREETGNTTTPGEWREAVVLRGRGGSPVHFFVGRARQICPMRPYAPDEPTAWHPLRDLPTLNVVPNLRWLIPLCLDPDVIFPVVIAGVDGPAVFRPPVR